MMRELQKAQNEIDELMAVLGKCQKRLQNGWRYLMEVQSDEITVEDALVAFGWDSCGYFESEEIEQLKA